MKGAFEEENGKIRLKSIISDRVIKSGERYLRGIDKEKASSMIDSNFDKSSYPHPDEVFYADHWSAIYISEKSESAELKIDSSFSPEGGN